MAVRSDRREAVSEKQRVKKSYASPRLEKFGDLRELTLGASLGTTDSDGQGKKAFG